MVDEFKKITGYDITTFITVSNAVVSRYSQNTDDLTNLIDPNVQSVIGQLIDQLNIVFNLFEVHKRQLVNAQYFELLDTLETIDNLLARMQNVKKWGKFFKDSLIENQIPEMQYVIREGETLENIAAKVLGSTNPNDDWFDIALNNDLNEEDYTPDGGNNIMLPLHIAGLERMEINSIVDVIDSETIKGKDIYKIITFEDNDLKTVTGLDCIHQTVEILMSLTAGDNSDFPTRGVQKGLFIGSNTSFLNYPSLLRQLNEVFSDDDSLTNFTIINFVQQGDTIKLDFSVTTRTNEVVNRSLQFK